MADNVASDKRKRALEALERRCAAAKVELLRQQKKISSTGESNRGKSDLTDSSSVVSGNPSGSSIPLPSKEKTVNKDVEESDQIYFTLSAAVNENLLGTHMDVSNNKVSNNRGVVNKICHELRTGGYVKRSRELKVDAWILLDNFVPKRPGMIGSRMRALRSNSKRSKRHMSMKQHKKCGTFDLYSDFHKFEIFLPMHDMWKSYMTQRLRHVGQDALARNLLVADLHGSIILVVECKIPAFTGTSGIMIRETAETFGIVTKDDKFRVVPKKSSVFIFQWDCWKITLLGDKLGSRISDLPRKILVSSDLTKSYFESFRTIAKTDRDPRDILDCENLTSCDLQEFFEDFSDFEANSGEADADLESDPLEEDMNNARFLSRVQPSSSLAPTPEALKAQKEELVVLKHTEKETSKKSSRSSKPPSDGGPERTASKKTPSPKTSLPSSRGEKEKKRKKKKRLKSLQEDDFALTSSKKRKVEQIDTGAFIFQTSGVDERIAKCASDLFRENVEEALAETVNQAVPPASSLKALMDLSTELLTTSCRVASQIYWELDARSEKFEQKRGEANKAKQLYLDLHEKFQEVFKENTALKNVLKESKGKLVKVDAELDIAVKNMEGYKALQLEHEKVVIEIEAERAKNASLRKKNSDLQKEVAELEKSFKDWKFLEPKIFELPEYGQWAKSLSDAGFKFAVGMFELQPQLSVAAIKRSYVDEWTTAPDGTRAPDEVIAKALKDLEDITITHKLGADEVIELLDFSSQEDQLGDSQGDQQQQ